MTLPIPPRYVVLPHDVIEQAYKGEKPKRALLASFTRILSLAWEAKYQRTPALNETELMKFLKLERRQYFQQKAEMEAEGWLRSTHPRPGFVQFVFSRNVAETVSAENRTASAKNRTFELMIEEEDLIKLNSESSSSILPEQKQVRKIALEADEVRKTAQLFEHLPLLFNPLEHGTLEVRKTWLALPFESVLGWITKAYHDRANLTKSGPLGLIVARLNEGGAPNRFYLTKYAEILPNEYLEAIGEIEYECPFCDARFGTKDESDAHERAEHGYVCEDCRPAIAFKTQAEWKEHFDAHHNPYAAKREESFVAALDGELGQAWSSVLTVLQEEMPRASFDTWVRDTQPVRYAGNVLQVGARNAYARDWLSQRLTEKTSTLAAQVLSEPVRVEFVVVTA